ncbi:PREDICTED: acetyl-CoA acetyltransferase, cytosolic [Nicrophorus vespilloides]|uniref:Acetyl-CoA acetyltransferase, cytosolic n=1 Tax=Nicrophorus vespilloides TaxID=110193 RepID=A0ABM1N9Y1_NICVS|nr:PREDICTED: acetyl-CoA acetyltransferase, cytosolic [Nicrophorus vespilloides]
MEDAVYIVSGCRTPIGNYKGQFSSINIFDLSKHALKGAILRSGIAPADIQEVYIGNVLTAGKGQNPARKAALNVGIPIEVPATTLNMLCGSGLKSVTLGYTSIKAGNSSVVLCAGMESMTQAEHSIYIRGGVKLGDCTLKDTMVLDGLTDSINQIHMGITAENVAKKYKISRAEQDAFALNSQIKAASAMEQGLFDDEIVPVQVGKDLIKLDEYPKPSTTIERLTKLNPVFLSDGTVTAGNASGINDGAAAVILANGFEVKSKNLKPLARIVGFAEMGNDPLLMGVAPIPTIKLLLKKVNWTKDDVELYEINEAFASQSVAIIKELDLDPKKVNVNGGAIALGHPIGASGTRVLVTLLYNLKHLGLKRGVAALCIGGGMGIAMAVEAV